MPKPMLTDDYLIRMINQAIDVLIRVINLKASGEYQQAQQLIEQSLEQLIGLRIDLLQSLDDQNILGTLSINGIPDANRILLGADLFKEEGEVPGLELFKQESTMQEKRKRYIKRYKKNRENARVEKALESLYEHAEKPARPNLFVPILEAVDAGATTGEIVDTLRKAENFAIRL